MDHPASDQPAPSRRRPAPPNDLRWMLISGGAFVGSLLLLAICYWLYRVTGPHPQVIMALRRLRYYSRWLLPGL